MIEHPILFSAPMVRALLEGGKTQTRRAVKPQPPAHMSIVRHLGDGDWQFVNDAHMLADSASTWRCPYGQPGDHRLWVRETFYAWGHWTKRYNPKKRKKEWHFVDETIGTKKSYRYDADEKLPRRKRELHEVGWWKRPAIFMHHWASRITLEVTGVRVERLQDISVADAIAEGCPGGDHGDRYAAVDQYRALWVSINGDGSWDANPCVWVVELKRVKP